LQQSCKGKDAKLDTQKIFACREAAVMRAVAEKEKAATGEGNREGKREDKSETFFIVLISFHGMVLYFMS
jgi:hypothetical protein